MEHQLWLEENEGVVYMYEGLVVQGCCRLLYSSTLLQVLLQSQRVDGEERHVRLQRRRKERVRQWAADWLQ